MDENTVRTLLGQVADDPLPPTTTDLEEIREHGRRRLRWRRLYLPAAVAAIAALIAAVVPLVLNDGDPSPQATGGPTPSPATKPSGRDEAPERFDPLGPYASFGWLPPGYSAGRTGLAENSQDAAAEALIAQPPHGLGMLLMVYAPGACHLTGPRHQKPDPANPGLVRGASSLDCDGFYGQLNSKAPSVDGAQAHWSSCQPESFCPARSNKSARWGRALAWKYGNDAWAVLRPRGSLADITASHLTNSLLLRVAKNVHYGGTRHEVFGFTLSNMPPGWHVDDRPDTGPAFRVTDGVLANTFVSIGPLTISAYPKDWPRAGCSDRTDPVTINGAHGYLVTGYGQQSLCFNDLNGMFLSLRLNVGINGKHSSGFGGVTEVFQHLRLFGPDPAHWTTDPFG